MGETTETKGIVGSSAALSAAMSRAEKAACTSLPVLVTGETGTGKELLSRFVHDKSHRRQGPYVVVNCAGFPRDLFDSALFGHERGAFTGARESNTGCFQAANGGTLVLDEVGELPLELQPKLLRVLEEGAVTPLGARKAVPVNVRVVAVTNRDLYSEAKTGAFRLDLFHRLCGITLSLPPLRERLGDLDALVSHFCHESGHTPTSAKVSALSPGTIARLREHDWPGNVRELRLLVWRTLAMGEGPLLESLLVDELRSTRRPAHDTCDDLPSPRAAEDGPSYSSRAAKADQQDRSTAQSEDPAWLCLQGRSWAEVESAVIRHHLRAAGGNRKRAAATLGISRTTLYERLKRISP
jgi:two-component system, NtrC family, nitrogen regulation response regulator GlnG